MRSESTKAFGQPRLTKPTLGLRGMGQAWNRDGGARPGARLSPPRPGGPPLHAPCPIIRTPVFRRMPMGQWTELETPAGSVAAWQADPPGTPRGGLVVIQEIFGVNPHIRAVADGYAAEGYVVLAPAFFDPVERGVELGYGEDGFARGRALVQELGTARALAILQAAAERLRADLAARQAPTAVGTV